MREDHRVDEADFSAKPGRDRIGKSGEKIGPEEEHTGFSQRKFEAFEQPQGQQRLDDKSAREGIQAEQRRKLENNGAGSAEHGRRRFRCRRRLWWNQRVKARGAKAKKRI